MAAGAADVVIADAREEFAHEFVLPILQAGALYEGRYPLVSALSRPLIARHLVAVAREVGATAVAHGCTGKGNDQVRFETAVAALAPDLAVLAPVRDWGMTREQEIAYAERHGIEVPVKSGAAYSIDQNLWGRSIEAGPLEDPWTAPPEAAYALTLAPERAFHAAQEVEITFEAGVPVAVDGEEMGLVELIARAAAVAGAHGVGRIDMIENRLVGIKSREVYETPAAALLLAAYAGVEELVCDRDLAHMKAELAARYATLVYNGLWFSPLRLALEAFMAPDVRRRHGDGAGQALPRVVRDRRPPGRVGALRPRPCDLRAWRQLPARSGRRVHPHLVAAHQDVGGRGSVAGDRSGMTAGALVRPAARRARSRRQGLHGLARGRPQAAPLRPARDGGARAHARRPRDPRRRAGDRDLRGA